ncbi:MAG: oligoendopeptidase F [Bradymonadales bacterium]|jgi:oligoendopeptidase F
MEKTIRRNFYLALAGIAMSMLTVTSCDPIRCDCENEVQEAAALGDEVKDAPVALDDGEQAQAAKAGQTAELADKAAASDAVEENVVKKEGLADANAARDSIDAAYLWKKDRLFTSNEAWQVAFDKAKAELPSLDRCKDAKSAEQIIACLDAYFTLHTDINKLTLYANMTDDTEPSADVKRMKQEGQALHHDFMAKSELVRNIVLKADADDDALQKYALYLRQIQRRASRVLSPDAERVLQLAGDNLWAEIDLNEIPSNAEEGFHALLDNMALPKIIDENGVEQQLTLSNYALYRRSPKREVRKAAVHGLFSTLAQFKDTLATLYVGQLKNDVFFAKARNYETALDAYLDKDQIDTSVYLNLINTVSENLEPLHRYVALRKNVLKLDSVHLYDLYIPLSQGIEKNIQVDEALRLITEGLKPLGPDYGKILAQYFDRENGSIDYFPHKNKRSGAYSCSVYGVEPFILMNYLNDMSDVSTLAHELGHSIHSLYAMQNQPPFGFHYTAFIAEIASTTNESLLNDYLYANAESDAEKIDLLVQKLENIRGTIYRQTLFADFEYQAHSAIERGEAINAQWLSDKYAQLVKKYYGPEYSFDEYDNMEWAYIPHFYYKYYVYSYATGLSSALSFAKLIPQSPENAEKYIDMLKAGGSDAPVTLLKNAGVDLTSPAPIQSALQEFDETLKELSALLKV